MIPNNYNYSFDPSLDGKIRIVGFKNGLPILEWVKTPKYEVPSECDFVSTFFPKNPEGARQYFKA